MCLSLRLTAFLLKSIHRLDQGDDRDDESCDHDHDDDNDDDDGEREISRLLARRCDTLVWMSLEIKAQNAPHMAALVGQDGGGDDDSGREVDDD